MRAAEAILNGSRTISTAEGDKNPGELADYIEAETRIVELIDAARRLLQALDEHPEPWPEPQGEGPSPEQRVEELREALGSVLEEQDRTGGGGRH